MKDIKAGDALKLGEAAYEVVSTSDATAVLHLPEVAKDADGIPGDSYNPQAYTITKQKVTSKSVLKVKMARCGGFAISLRSK